VVLHKIYASAREKNRDTITGLDLFQAVKEHHSRVYYFEEVMDALPFLQDQLKTGDILITLGAGDNFRLSHKLYEIFQNRRKAS
ncbi:MAG TPA: UDP-N-acetylmuramate--L-alanine ligase, partial [Spirochaetales bacterium]|nr:UDP-N-acetylmuramate--L-alanine ligase [Spirochaetales bacterium]